MKGEVMDTKEVDAREVNRDGDLTEVRMFCSSGPTARDCLLALAEVMPDDGSVIEGSVNIREEQYPEPDFPEHGPVVEAVMYLNIDHLSES